MENAGRADHQGINDQDQGLASGQRLHLGPGGKARSNDDAKDGTVRRLGRTAERPKVVP